MRREGFKKEQVSEELSQLPVCKVCLTYVEVFALCYAYKPQFVG